MASFTTRPVVMSRQRRRNFRPLSRIIGRLADAGAWRQRHRRSGGNGHLRDSARTTIMQHRRRSPHACICSQRAQDLCRIRYGLVSAGVHHRMVPAERHRPHSRRRLSARLRASSRWHMDDCSSALGNDELHRDSEAHDRPRRERIPCLSKPASAPLHPMLSSTPTFTRRPARYIFAITAARAAPPRWVNWCATPISAPCCVRFATQRSRASGKGRIAGIEAACDEYYKGNVAETILRSIQDNPVEDASGMEHKGLLSYEDFAAVARRRRAARVAGIWRFRCAQVLVLDAGSAVLAAVGDTKDDGLRRAGAQ